MHTLKGLYAIADSHYISIDNFTKTILEVLSAGVKIIQYRDKKNDHDIRYTIANELKSLTIKYQGLLIINDDVLLAQSINADGVHLGKQDCSISEARNILGPNKIIGASCYAHFDNALSAVKEGANYIAFGSFFDSLTKPSAPRANLELLTHAKKELSVPVCAIGGITKNNIMPLLHAGVDMVAVVSAIFAAASPKQATLEFLSRLQQFDLTA